MTRITADFSKRTGTGIRKAVSGKIRATPTRATLEGPEITLPAPVTIPFNGPVTFDLEPTPLTGEWYYRLEITVTNIGVWTESVLVPDLEFIIYEELTPMPDHHGGEHRHLRTPEPEWWATLENGLKSARPGPPNALTIGTVEAGTTAKAVLRGSAPEQVLDLVMPRGLPGKDSTIPGPVGPRGPIGVTGPAGPNTIPTTEAVRTVIDAERENITGSVDVATFGAQADTTKDSTAAIQAAIDYAKNRFINSQMSGSNIVTIPAGKYKITSRITQPPYVKIHTLGTVIIEANVPADSAWHVTPLTTDPTNLYTGLQKQQWLRGNIIDGSRGGFIIINRGERGETVGLELGARADQGSNRPLSRYAMGDIAIQGFHVGQQLNSFQHYIAHYNRFHIESNDIQIRIGTVGVKSINSGENFNWNDAVIAGGDIGVQKNVTSIDTAFHGTSLDFLNTGIQDNAGWSRIYFDGHIEAINEGSRRTEQGGIVVSTIADTIRPSEVIIGDETPFVIRERGTAFKGRMNLYLSMHYRNISDFTRMGLEDNILCNDGVIIRSMKYTVPEGGPFPSRKLNLIRDANFTDEVAGTTLSALTHWEQKTLQKATAVISDTGPRAGAKSLKITLEPTGIVRLTDKNYIPVQPAETISVAMGHMFTGGPYPSQFANVSFYDANKVQINTRDNQLYRTNEALNEWRTHDGARAYTAPPGAAYARISYQLSSTPGGGATEYYISDLTAYRS